MKIPAVGELIKSKLFMAGLVFIGVNLWFSYKFYQVNSYKILLVLIGVSILAIWNDLLFPRKVEKWIPWKQIVIVSLPLLATLPGIIWYQEAYNYNFRYELASNLVLIVWITFLFRGVRKKDDLLPFFFLIGILIVYVGLWAILERIGFHPLMWDAAPQSRVKSTFGNINYFAGFLVLLIPVLLSFCLPEKLPDSLSFKDLYPENRKSIAFYGVVFLIAVLCLALTQTRAAQGAIVISLLSAVFFYILTFSPPKYQKWVLISGAALIALGIVTLILLVIFREYLPENRYTRLLTLEGWTPRFAGWIPAINSIKASPWIGYGLGSSYNLYFAFLDPNARLFHREHSYNHVHSEFLEYTQEAGLIGFAVMIGFWCYIAYLLIKTLISDQIDPFLKKLAVGIIGGFVGYHIQSAFSVAPRMMVVKLPMFTLIGLTLVLAKLAHPNQDFETSRTLSGRLKSFLPAFIVLTFTWLIFTPWLIGQYRYIKIRGNHHPLLAMGKLEKLVEQYPDAYALDHLAHLQIRYNRAPQLQKTLDLIDETLPNYRDLGYTKAFLAIMQNDLDKAKQIALEFQNRQDRYHKPTIFLLMGLAFDTNDYQLFKGQFDLFVRKLIFDNRLHYSLRASDVEIKFGSMDMPFQFKKTNNGFETRWNERLIQSIYNAGRSVRLNKSYTSKEQKTFLSFLSFQFSRHPYFQLSVKDRFKDQAKEINQRMRSYFLLNQQAKKKSKELDDKHKLALKKAKPSTRQALAQQLQAEKKEADKLHQVKMKELTDYLAEHADWELFLKNRNFISTFITEMNRIIYPPKKRK